MKNWLWLWIALIVMDLVFYFDVPKDFRQSKTVYMVPAVGGFLAWHDYHEACNQ